MKITDLEPGIKLEMELYDRDGKAMEPILISEFEWAEDDGFAVIAAPIHEGIIYPVHTGTVIDIFFGYKLNNARGMNMYKLRARVRGRRVVDNIALLEIIPEGEIEKIQRRQYFRFSCSTAVYYRALVLSGKEETADGGEEYKRALAVDLSGCGMRMLTVERLEYGTFLEIEIKLNDNISLKLPGKVVRVTPIENNDSFKYEEGIWFKKIDSKHREEIIRYIFQEQRKLRKKGLI
ncbi:c-di-GMP-binding flagellar brake protein YcgR [Anaerobacterium chartisolvens]|uniref:C-di-GMP-binding flagellar brake protein YcgR n=1 Tax=Anaerobacterium chartisolvens TaxID=1297424 RepID=A0A369B259_9FIRM|nr:PilZ domain-containing protein [Anaerobacterium chartisolvens]RCX15533.1 c-di-GMP-binding flagellar brake protein YcgR [Anaerobacterium chartisolvens]